MSESGFKLRLFGWYIPLYAQIITALVLAMVVGLALGGGTIQPGYTQLIENLTIPCNLILKALRTLATPLIFLAVLHTFLTAEIPGRAGRRLSILLLTNTTVAILIGLTIANLLKPGTWGQIAPPSGQAAGITAFDPLSLLQTVVPEAIAKPFVDNNVIQLIVISLAFGIALRALKAEQIARGQKSYLPIEQIVGIGFDGIVKILNWVIALIPLAVFGIVAKTIALQGFAPFRSLLGLIVAVLIALFLQMCYYLTRVKIQSWVKLQDFLTGGADAFFTAFSTSSSTIAMPITFAALKDKIGIRESSASLGAMVGSNFNNDGTALYEAMAALFVAQLLGQELQLTQQILIVITSIFASVGAAGIPNAGLVTMTLVFKSVGLPESYVLILITVDWFLDRCRTVINLMGDMTVSCILDGKVKPVQEVEESVLIQ